MAKVKSPLKRLDEDGFGFATYEVEMAGSPFTLIAYSAALDDDKRSDRVIAEAWDACFALFDGRPTVEEIEHFKPHVCSQEAGRYDERVLVLSRANKSVRLFAHVVEALAKGEQPDRALLFKTGYLMRTTAVYGNGKFGIADRTVYSGRGTLGWPFRLEMLSVLLIREFTLDLVEHLAKVRGGDQAVGLSDANIRCLGIGNSTGLGMAPFLGSHPELLNNWVLARETALSRVRSIETTSEKIRQEVASLVERITAHLDGWRLDDPAEEAEIAALRKEWAEFSPQLNSKLLSHQPFDEVMKLASAGSESLQELAVALVLEPHGALIDDLAENMAASAKHALNPAMSVGALKHLIEENYSWALELDLSEPAQNHFCWYVSEEKLEPRLGPRDGTVNAEQEMPLTFAHRLQALAADLEGVEDAEPVANVLAGAMHHRRMVQRIQTLTDHPYGEIRDNLIANTMRPIDMLRCKLAFFGASRFDPRSDRWTRITLYQGAPRLNDLTEENCSDVFLPALGAK